MKSRYCRFIILGATLVALGTALLYLMGWIYAILIYFLGSIVVGYTLLSAPCDSTDAIVRRLRGQQIFGVVLLVANTLLMVVTNTSIVSVELPGNLSNPQSPAVVLLLSIVVLLYTTYRIGVLVGREEEEN